jgi:hypothetical protein
MSVLQVLRAVAAALPAAGLREATSNCGPGDDLQQAGK